MITAIHDVKLDDILRHIEEYPCIAVMLDETSDSHSDGFTIRYSVELCSSW